MTAVVMIMMIFRLEVYNLINMKTKCEKMIEKVNMLA